jgi:pilus assembly protein CpaC
VKFAEVDRQALTDLGVNIFSTGAGNTIGQVTTGQFSPVQSFSLNDSFPRRGGVFSTNLSPQALNVFLFNPQIHLGIAIQALQSKNLLQILAEPNLMTESGKEANFLAGGEFPYPSVQSIGGGGGSTPAVTIQFKEFGIRLAFIPVLGADGTIHLKVKPEVSTLDFANGVIISGFNLPALSTRRVESEMSLADGQTFAIAGLVDNRVTEIMSKVPGIGDIPVLGNLFKSKSFNKNKTELLVIVTPHIVKPLNQDQVPHGPNFPQPFLDQVAPGQSTAPASK